MEVLQVNRNDEFSFKALPSIDLDRSKFNKNHSLLTTMNTGDLVPIFCEEVIPGSTITMDLASLVRMSTPIFPVMDNAFMDTYFFYCPSRILWNHFKEFMGENSTNQWAPSVEYQIPQLTAPSNGWNKGSVADYFGIPTDVPNISVNALPFRAYAMIWNEWFRDQNTMPPTYCPLDDQDRSGQLSDPDMIINSISAVGGGTPLRVSRFHDYFSSCLPGPFKSLTPVNLPIFSDDLPVTTLADDHNGYDSIPAANRNPLRWNGDIGGFSLASSGDYYLGAGALSDDGQVVDGYQTISIPYAGASSNYGNIYPSNLAVQRANIATGTINELRQAFQIQRLLERDARSGTRFREILLSHFGLTVPDSRVQIPEYLGGKRIPINVDQVLQTSATNDVSPQGNTAAYSLTTDVSSIFTKSFVEPGYVIGVACIRTEHTYQQGIERFWSRKRRFDFYWPELAHLGEQPVYVREIFAQGNDTDDSVFGYQEAWADYRYKPNRVSGAFRSNYNGTLDSWHYADFYDESTGMPVLQAQWMSEGPANVDRTLAVQSELEDQFLCNFAFKESLVAPIPLYSVPGLIDHI